MNNLAPVIDVDEKKCVNCHACIAACPVKFAIDGSGDYVQINHDLCIGCGNCIEACTHDARTPRDDFDAFMEALQGRQPMVAIAAPAVASSFPDRYLNLNGYLKSLGVESVFDVSFGAELTVMSYLKYVAAEQPDTVIAQPCPAIVTYLEIYQPELLKHLAPAHSPMLHTIQLIRTFFPQYNDHRIAVISPCVAKRREFDETGMGDYNVTMKSLRRHIDGNSIDLTSYPRQEFETPLPERAVLFSSPGGLKQTVLRENPSLENAIRKIEGPEIIYDYLEKLPAMLDQGFQPLLVDCLNCDLGCNGGPGTLNQGKSPDEIEHFVEQRKATMQQEYSKRSVGRPRFRKKMARITSKYWLPGIYDRTYQDRSGTYAIRTPSAAELTAIYRSMHKYEEKDFYNCTSCGYNSCEKMAVAVYNGLNKPENCHYYTQRAIEIEHDRYIENAAHLHDEIGKARQLMTRIAEALGSANDKNHTQNAALEQSSASIEQMMSSIGSASKITTERKKAVDDLIVAARKGQGELQDTIRGIEGIAESVKNIGELIDVINGVASSTNLLSVNAAIEAAHAGHTGRGFSVVAEEIRRLAETTAGNAKTISATLGNIIKDISNATVASRETGDSVGGIIDEIASVADSLGLLTNSMQEMSAGSSQITDALVNLKDVSYGVRDSYSEISESVLSMQTVLERIGEISDRNVGDQSNEAAE